MISRKSFICKPRCHHCGELGHIKKYCREFRAEKEAQKERRAKPHEAAPSTTQENSDNDSHGLIAAHALSVFSSNDCCAWIADSGATCHMCQGSKSFTNLYQLDNPIDVTLGDGRALLAVRRGELVLDMTFPSGESKSCTLHVVLYVPELSYNLLSVAKASRGERL